MAAGLHLSQPSTDSRRRVAGVVALLCVASFLFPVISMSDDMHTAATVTEPSKQRNPLPLIAIACCLLAGIVNLSYPGDWQKLILGARSPRKSRRTISYKLSKRPPPLVA